MRDGAVSSRKMVRK